jgi:hypothetical protein
MYDRDEPPTPVKTRTGKKAQKDEYGSFGKEARILDKFRKYLAKVTDRDRHVLLNMLQQMAKR